MLKATHTKIVTQIDQHKKVVFQKKTVALTIWECQISFISQFTKVIHLKIMALTDQYSVLNCQNCCLHVCSCERWPFPTFSEKTEKYFNTHKLMAQVNKMSDSLLTLFNGVSRMCEIKFNKNFKVFFIIFFLLKTNFYVRLTVFPVFLYCIFITVK